jgi:hypothetical protein
MIQLISLQDDKRLNYQKQSMVLEVLKYMLVVKHKNIVLQQSEKFQVVWITDKIIKI